MPKDKTFASEVAWVKVLDVLDPFGHRLTWVYVLHLSSVRLKLDFVSVGIL